MKINKVLLSILAVSAFSCTYAEERVLNMDFSEAPEKIEEVRTKAGGKKKNETVDFYIAIPPTEGKDFTFVNLECALTESENRIPKFGPNLKAPAATAAIASPPAPVAATSAITPARQGGRKEDGGGEVPFTFHSS